jgi:hypothetical protein
MLACGSNPSLPDFHVRIECRAGSDGWTLTERLPSPRPPGLSEEERAKRKQILTLALNEIEEDLDVLRSSNWHTVPLRDERFVVAHSLIIEHAPDWTGPVRDARIAIDEFRSWNSVFTSAVESEIIERKERLSSILGEAHRVFRDLLAALDMPQASGVRWRD